MATKLLDISPNLQMWADITIKQFEKKARTLGIHDGDLIRSFEAHVLWHSGGDIARIEILYLYYGKFVDMGVGRGVKFQDVKNSRRTPKPWFTKTFYKEFEILKYKLAELLADKVPQMIAEQIEK